MSGAAAPPGAPGDDAVLPFQVGEAGAGGSVRGRLVRLGPAVDAILSAHGFSPPLSELTGEALALVAAMGASLKFEGRLILQAQGDGPAGMVVADYTSPTGALRATAGAGRPPPPPSARGLAGLIGRGTLAMTVDPGPDMDRYQGVTPLDGDSLAASAVGYFDRSEQVPTALRVAVGRCQAGDAPERWRAGALLLQYVPAEGGDRVRGEDPFLAGEGGAAGGDGDLWTRAAALAATVGDDELIDPDLAPERLLYRLFHEDGVRVFDPTPVAAACRCAPETIAAVLARYPAADLAEMAEAGEIAVDCEFCRKRYRFDTTGALLG